MAPLFGFGKSKEEKQAEFLATLSVVYPRYIEPFWVPQIGEKLGYDLPKSTGGLYGIMTPLRDAGYIDMKTISAQEAHEGAMWLRQWGRIEVSKIPVTLDMINDFMETLSPLGIELPDLLSQPDGMLDPLSVVGTSEKTGIRITGSGSRYEPLHDKLVSGLGLEGTVQENFVQTK